MDVTTSGGFSFLCASKLVYHAAQNGGASTRHQALKTSALDRPMQALHSHTGRRRSNGAVSPSATARMVAASAAAVAQILPRPERAPGLPRSHFDAANRCKLSITSPVPPPATTATFVILCVECLQSTGICTSSEAKAEALAKLEARVAELEIQLGPEHPHVGKAWLHLSRAYQRVPTPAHARRAEHALVRRVSALSDIHSTCQRQTAICSII